MKIISQKNEYDNPAIESCSGFFKRFNLSKILRQCGETKKCGVLTNIVFLFLLGVVFTGKKLNTLMGHYREEIPFGKDVVYRYIDRPTVNWERTVFLAAKSVIPEIKKLTSDERKSALVFDDTPQYRDRSKKVEMLSLCHDHSKKGKDKYYKGHTILTMGWTDGVTFIPVDYRVLSASDDKNLIHGSNIAEDNRTLATKRRNDARAGKPALVLEMLRNVKGSEADAGYVMFDSWFSSPSSIIPVCTKGYEVVARLKNNNTKYLYKGEMMTLKQIYSKNRKRSGMSKYLLSVDIEVRHKDFEHSVAAKVVFVRNKKKRKEWIALISTDLSLSEEEIIALYGKRWDIEVFFKVCKSVLKLGKEFQCRSFDSTCALVAIVFIRYMKLAVDNRENKDDRSLGTLFLCCCKELDDISFAQAFALLLEAFANFMHDSFALSECDIQSAVDDFISSLPAVIRQKLYFSPCET
jgi:hypothetical protein